MRSAALSLAAASRTRPMVTGEPVIALCGKVWVPGRDPNKFPVCPMCKEVIEGMRSREGGSGGKGGKGSGGSGSGAE